ncbi:MAG: hypothetical protein IJP69_03590 [Synergistaceae bacterium]|nr:hypothetical protein [Synergistaceae bacterium]
MANDYNVTHAAKVGHLKQLLQDTKVRLTDTIKFVSCANNTISFFKTADGSGTAAFSFNFPSELVLDQLKTKFVGNFVWSSATYPGSTNPELDGKPVLVIAIKETDAAGTATTSYSFLNMESLVDIYTAADKSITIDGYTIGVKIDPAQGNRLTLTANGLMVDVSDKADKDTDAVAGNIAIFDENGNPIDSGTTFATNAEITAMIADVYGA